VIAKPAHSSVATRNPFWPASAPIADATILISDVHMPGRRNLARERAAHQLTSPAHQAALYQQLHDALPHSEVALIGQQAILLYLSRLGVRRLNGGPLTWRILLSWRTCHGCPILRGNRASSYKSHPFSTSHALTAWLLTRFATGLLFRTVAMSQPVAPSEASPHAQADAA
jgi:hypothetical protein